MRQSRLAACKKTDGYRGMTASKTGFERAQTLRAMLVLALGLLAFGLQASERFVPGFEALPLMAGLTVEPDSAMAFEKPDGRIVETAAVGNLSEMHIRNWYSEALPQLGWQPAGDGLFRREREVLSLTVTRENVGVTRVAFRLYPQ